MKSSFCYDDCLLLIRSPSCRVYQRSPLARCSLQEPDTHHCAHDAQDEDDAHHAQGRSRRRC